MEQQQEFLQQIDRKQLKLCQTTNIRWGKILHDLGISFHYVRLEGGVFRRNGHTEATIDLMDLAGLKKPVFCVKL